MDMHGLAAKIKGSENVGRSHTVYEGFSDFVKLHLALKNKQTVTANLPPKQLFGKLSGAVIKRRQEGLDKYLEVLLKELNMIYSFLQVPQTLLSSMQGNISSATGGDVDSTGHSSKTESLPVPMASNSDDAANREIVDQISDLMIDVFQMPLPAKGMDYEMRCKKYRTMVEKVPWPLEHGEDLSRYLLRAIDPSNLPAPTMNNVKSKEESMRLLREATSESSIFFMN
ncbi:hypothetical protein GUITHDRAFT_115232 [Guillardia theta CCMP2712]|uniref:PX domain-containing protein n=1 Tax=Guillardia theta (strain CCMP2712) TaxID=905079 RepID=L1IS05_GUITC|nr:hypothetical protein GUITHDRAFT_115232 [Guillardia theta CCMP2712]EKX38684.1 hypothetical protein GUITHDRAFT_115232 [Guillardia theta CCMP2712]|eukprot:XP_005825664.1 hypothetical protein GUITHDRAFT_115232 [Guillardia theta CCMP2712]